MCNNLKNGTLQLVQFNVKSLDAQNICLIIISSLGVLLNGFLLLGVRIPNSCSAFVRNLAVEDLCTSIISFLWIFRRSISSKHSVTILETLSWMFVFISFLTIFAIAVQRYIAVAHALWTYSVMKNNFNLLKMLSATTWLISIIFCSTRLYINWNIVSFIITIIFEVLILSTVILYFMVFRSFHQYLTRDRQGHSLNETRLKLQFEKEKKLTKTVFWISGLLIVAILPYVILLQLNKIGRLFNTLDVLRCNATFADFTYYWVLLEMLAFSLNPVIYLSRYQTNCSKLIRIRQRLVRVLPKRNFRISAEESELNMVQQTRS